MLSELEQQVHTMSEERSSGCGAEYEPQMAEGEEVSPDDVGVDSDEGSEEGSEGSEELSEGSDTQEASPEQLLAMGKKCLAAGDATGAVEHFQDACSLLAEVYGQMAKELAEPYYLYGQALLELSREKSAMFGKGIPVPGDAEGASSSTADDAGSSDGNDEGDPQAPPAPDSSVPDTSEGGAEAKPTAEEESDLQLSWQVLELARLICQREGDDKHRLQLSDVNLALGEVGMESDQYEQAIADLQSSLRLREFVLDPTDRRIAEVHFNLGMAHTLARQADEAITSYNASKTLLNKRREMLKTRLAEESDVTQQQELHCEIRELESLIPDLESKIADVEDFKKVLQEREKQENEPEECIGFDAPSKELATKLSTVAPVNDITHLIRKRKVGSELEGDIATKRVCAESVIKNGIPGEEDASPCQSTLPPASEQ